jgi:phage shock protein A
MSYTLEREAERLAAQLRAYARDARRPLEAGEDPDAILEALAAKLVAAASGLEHELAAIHQARERDAARQRAAEPTARQFRGGR